MKLKFNLFLKHQEITFGLIGIVLLLIIWQIISFSKLVNPIFISSPLAVSQETINLLKSGELYANLIISLEELLIGFVLSLVIGVAFGIVFGWYKKANFLTKPIIYAVYTTPIVAIFPLIILWFGLGFIPKILLIFIASIFPILITVVDAVRNIDSNYLRLGKSFGANDYKLITTVVLPYCLPNVFSAARVALPRAIIGMVLAEFFIGGAGLGYLISYFAATFQTAKFFSVILILIIINLFFNIVIERLEKLFSYN